MSAEENQTAGKLVPSNISIELCFVEHRRGVHSGVVWAGAASGRRRQDERTRCGPGVWVGARDGAEDAALFGAAWLPKTATGAPAEAGRLDGSHRPDPGRRQGLRQ